MSKITLSVRINDFGQFHGLLCKFQLVRQGEEETVHIRYGFKMGEGFYPCSAVRDGNNVLLSKAGIGKLGDVVIKMEEWYKILKGLRSTELLTRWQEGVQNRKVA